MKLKIGIIGAGAAGLAAAYDLAKAGHEVAVFESAPFAGGQASTLEVSGARLERGYHHIFTTDKALIDLMRELDIADDLKWFRSTVGTFIDGKIYSTTTPMDLLRLKPISFTSRLRLGLLTLSLRRMRDWRKLEAFTADSWLRSHIPADAYNIIWKPLLRTKFGSYYEKVWMPWFWSKIQTRFASRDRFGREILGYPIRSFDVLFERLRTNIEEHAGRIMLETPVRRILTEGSNLKGLLFETKSGRKESEEFDYVLSTAPSFVLSTLADFPDSFRSSLDSAVYLGAVVIILEMEKPLTNFYWINITDEAVPFLGLIEHTNLVPTENYGGSHVVYITNYLDRNDPLFKMSPNDLWEHYLPHLSRFNSDFDPSWVKKRHYNALSAAQPVMGVNYTNVVPPHTTPIRGLYFVNTTHIYPEDRGVNYSIRLGRRLAKQIQLDISGVRADQRLQN